MDWIKNLQNAINYVEENLTNEINLEDVSKIANSSATNFQRVFSILCNCTLGEYIRNRRLSLAGNELATSNSKIIDIAFKYGYDSPESFTRAFIRFHNIKPSQVKKNGGNLKSFSKISVKLTLDGGSIMDYQIKKLDEFKLISIKKYFPIEIEKSQKEIPAFWSECKTNGSFNALCTKYFKKDSIFGDAVVGVCFENSDRKDEFPYGIGVYYNGEKCEDDFIIDTIEPLTWAIFKCKGPMPSAIQELLHSIYSEFFPSSEYTPNGGYYLEVYPDGDITAKDYKSEVWISVDKK
ncbi:MAG: AraC family transcriptional regulator [Pleomorphochaeta sp.]